MGQAKLPCLWERELDDISLLKVMFGTLQALLCIVMPEPVQWPGKAFDRYDQQHSIKDMKLQIKETTVQLCLFAAYKFRDIDPAYRIPMLDEYMTTMGLRRMITGTHNRLIYISPENSLRCTRYVCVMTTPYENKSDWVHWTEGLSYPQYWVQDHLTQTNLLIKDYDYYILSKDNIPGKDRNDELNYFLKERYSTTCIKRDLS
jgi:hypothetical protein